MMIRVMTVVALVGLGVSGARAQEPKADCSRFRKLSDGRWMSTVESRVGNPQSFITLQPGLPIERDLMVVGINVSDTIDRLCGSPK